MNRQHQNLAGFTGFIEDILGANGARIFGENAFSGDWNKNVLNVPVNIKEKEDGYYMEVVAPGLSKEAIKLQIEENVLVIFFEAMKESNEESDKTNGKVLKSEYAIRSFKRSFKVGNKVDIEKISAKYENGILFVALPKKEVVLAGNKTISID